MTANHPLILHSDHTKIIIKHCYVQQCDCEKTDSQHTRTQTHVHSDYLAALIETHAACGRSQSIQPLDTFVSQGCRWLSLIQMGSATNNL